MRIVTATCMVLGLSFIPALWHVVLSLIKVMVGRRQKVQLSIISPTGYTSSTCGYCTAPGSGKRSTTKSSKSYGIWAHRLSPYHYQNLIDQGWRRSGDYIYKPDLLRTCCPQIPIRLAAHEYKPTKGHKRALSNLLFRVRDSKAKPAKWKGRWSRGRDWDVEKRWDEIVPSAASTSASLWAENVAGPITHNLEIRLALASTSDEKYQLFRKYQAKIHGEAEADISTEKGFCRFLVDSNLALTWPSTGEPLTPSQEAAWRAKSFDSSTLPEELPYGNYHQEYRLDGKVIAVGVLDILPKCVSSVYVFYDPEYYDWELGKVTALQEIALTRRLSRLKAMEEVRFYYMGFYIHTCQKMKYKAEYRPSQLLDCAHNTWRELKEVGSRLDSKQYFDWSNGTAQLRQAVEADPMQGGGSSEAEEEDSRVPTLPQPPPGMLDAQAILRALDQRLHGVNDSSDDEAGLELLQEALILEAKNQAQGIKPLLMSHVLQDYIQAKQDEIDDDDDNPDLIQAIECIAALSNPSLVSQTVLFM